MRPPRGKAGEMIEQAARPRLVLALRRSPAPPPRCARAGAANRHGRRCRASGLASLDLEAGGQRLIGQPFERAGIGPQRISRMAGKRAAGEHGEARQREPLRAPDLATGGGVAKPPVRPGPGIEQHADDGEIEFGARPRGAVAPTGGAGEARPAVLRRRARNAASANEREYRDRDRPRCVTSMVRSAAHRRGGGRSIRKYASPSSRPLRSSRFARSRTAAALSSDSAASASERLGHAQYFSSGRPTVPAGPGDAGSGE